MAKNGNGEGSIYEHKRNGKKVGYRGAYTVHTAEGPKRRYVTGKTRDEVRRKLAKATSDRDCGLVFDAESLTVGEYLDQWLSDSVRCFALSDNRGEEFSPKQTEILPVSVRLWDNSISNSNKVKPPAFTQLMSLF